MSVSGLRLTFCALLLGGAAPIFADGFEESVSPFLSEHCTFCHNGKMAMAGLNLDSYHDESAAREGGEVWDKVLAKLRSGEMPPAGRPRPGRKQLDRIYPWLEGEVARRREESRDDPGRVTARRLNRDEYNNTIRDLLGLDLRPADDFPVDDSGYGFDNIGDVLSVSPVLMERYLSAAGKVARAAIVLDEPLPAVQQRYRPEPEGEYEGRGIWASSFEARHEFPVEADYEITLAVGGKHEEEAAPVLLTISVDGQAAHSIAIPGGSGDRKFTETLRLKPGTHSFAMELAPLDPGTEPPVANTRAYTLVPDRVEISGPYNQSPAPLTESHRRIFICGERGQYDAGCTDRILTNLARRAYRRTVSAAEVSGLHRLVTLAMERGASWEEGVQVALQGVLVSPNFLFRIERDEAPEDPKAVHQISSFELASRLSYFIWSSMPDEELLRLAELDLLQDAQVLEAQTRRMLADPKSESLVTSFAGQWLQLRNLQQASPDPEVFPEFDEALREAMLTETELFFKNLMREDRSVLELIDGDYTYLNERLAAHYGIEGVDGSHFRRVALEGGQRSGVLTHASVLTVSSYPTRTSPVLRGLWVLENFLGEPPPPPPPDVPAFDDSEVGITGTLREQFEQHRADPACAVCHDKIDPLGFGLENYDATGAWRTHDGEFPVDAAGTLPGGREFETPEELKQILKASSDAFTECVTEKMLTFALGRGLESSDRQHLESISHKVAAGDHRFSRLVLEIVASKPFQLRRGEAVKSARGAKQ